MFQDQTQKTCSNGFFCRGRYVGSSNKRSTPAGMFLEDFGLSVQSGLSWKQKRNINVNMTCFGEMVDVLKTLKTGDDINVEGLIDEDQKDGIKLIATKIQKETRK